MRPIYEHDDGWKIEIVCMLRHYPISELKTSSGLS